MGSREKATVDAAFRAFGQKAKYLSCMTALLTEPLVIFHSARTPGSADGLPISADVRIVAVRREEIGQMADGDQIELIDSAEAFQVRGAPTLTDARLTWSAAAVKVKFPLFIDDLATTVAHEAL